MSAATVGVGVDTGALLDAYLEHVAGLGLSPAKWSASPWVITMGIRYNGFRLAAAPGTPLRRTGRRACCRRHR